MNITGDQPSTAAPVKSPILSVDTLKKVIQKKGYKWFTDRPNIIGIRSSLNVPEVFNDIMGFVYYENGKEIVKFWPITTDPGVYYQKNLLNSKGCAVMKPGQYVDAYALGAHIKPTHKALIQVRPVTVYRDADKDGISEAEGKEDTGLFGVNIHGANNGTVTKTIGPWSAGCQVHSTWSNKEEMIAICENFKGITGNKFTYTLINETDLFA
jgi:hypothetical protein